MESLGPQPLGRWPHLLLRALQHKGLQHLTDAEDRSALLRFINCQKKKQTAAVRAAARMFSG